ncbi:MAG TPA: ATPase domain-containing protein [Candidatus Thermoplasmatota archaeon]|nr:ATPase domain-containing protein [Candidatus Thermoplasmatota archaeon]
MAFKFNIERDELAERLGGGIPEGSLVVIEGEYGSGKSILLQRLVYGILENNHSVSYVSSELTTINFLDQMYSLDYGVEEHVLAERLVFIPVYTILGYRAPKVDTLDRILKARRMYQKDIIAVDSFSNLLKNWIKSLPPDVELTNKIEEAVYFFKLLNSQGKTVILTMETGEVPEPVIQLLRAAADVYLSLRLDVVGNNVSRSVLVRRFARAPKGVADVVNFRVEPKTGFIVEIKSVS